MSISALVLFCFSPERKRAKVPEQLTPPVQEEPEPVSSVLQGGDILALAIKKEDLKKVRIKSRDPLTAGGASNSMEELSTNSFHFCI